MALSEFHASTIIRSQAYFGFNQFVSEPDEITRIICVQPDSTQRKGDAHILANGKVSHWPFNSWSIESHSDSKDVNIHLRELLERLHEVKPPFPERFGVPGFSVLWKGNYLYAGSGPFYEADVLQGIASLKVGLWQDIYQIDQEENEPIGPEKLARI